MAKQKLTEDEREARRRERRQQERQGIAVSLIVAEVLDLVDKGETYLDAGCMVVSWYLANHVDYVIGDGEWTVFGGDGGDRDLQAGIQHVLRAVFGTTEQA